jgi:hypothetical protein
MFGIISLKRQKCNAHGQISNIQKTTAVLSIDLGRAWNLSDIINEAPKTLMF